MPTEDILLTKIRQAVWDAVDNYAPLDGLIRTKYRFLAEDEPDDATPKLSEMPALEIYSARFAAPMKRSGKQADTDLRLAFKVWIAKRALNTGEELFQRICEALANTNLGGVKLRGFSEGRCLRNRTTTDGGAKCSLIVWTGDFWTNWQL